VNSPRDLIQLISTVGRLLRTEADRRARRDGLTRAQWSILLHVSRTPGLLQKELAQSLEVDPMTVARLVDRLEARALVERQADPTDRRVWRLHLTDAGRALLADIIHQVDDIAALAIAGLAPSALLATDAALRTVRDNLAAAPRRPSAADPEPQRPTLQPTALQRPALQRPALQREVA
jgi:DNA-binding MarR family transcriptional regulator